MDWEARTRLEATPALGVLTMLKNEEPDGRTCWTLGPIETWAPRLPIDTCQTRKVSGGRVVSGKYLIGDKFVCFFMSAEEREWWKQEFPDAPGWLDNPPWDDHPGTAS